MFHCFLCSVEMSLELDEAWSKFARDFDSKYADWLPCARALKSLGETGFNGCPNLLFYSAGFPINLVWMSLLQRVHSTAIPSNAKTWDKDLLFNESKYHFELDMSLPQQSKSLSKITDFIKSIASHHCMTGDRHVMVISHIEHLFETGGCGGDNAAQAFRVLLERYSSNIIFICTTAKITAIEKPLISRFLAIRVPLFTESQISQILGDLALSQPFVPLQHRRNIAYCIYAAICDKHKVRDSPELHFPFLLDYPSASIDQLRSLTHKLHALDASISHITSDLAFLAPPHKKEYITRIGAQIDHMLACTDGNRKSLYIEYLLNGAF